METKNIFKAIAEFQQAVPVIHKGVEGYGYSYADLPAIFEVINPLLKEHGLGFTQGINGTALKTTIFHIESGEYLESTMDIPQGVTLSKMNQFQVLGSAITYLRRYALSAMLGLVTDKDIDAAGEQVKSEAKPAAKAKLDVTKETFPKAIASVASGEHSVEWILSKYDVTPEALKQLTEAETGFKSQQK